MISPVAELIKARNRPFIFATGYGTQGVPEDYRDRPALQKPFQIETLAEVIASTLKASRRSCLARPTPTLTVIARESGRPSIPERSRLTAKSRRTGSSAFAEDDDIT